MQAHDPTHAKGVDVSSWQGAVDWAKVRAAGYSFAFAKATEGVGYTDSAYARNVAGAKAAGLVTGAYHFARPNGPSADAESEAAYFVGVVRANPRPDMLALDLEATQLDKAATTDWALAFLAAVEKAFPNIRLLVYTGPAFISQHLDAPRLARWPLWIAHYTTAPAPANVAGWTAWTIWQWSSSGQVPGIAGRVDLDEFAGSEDELRAWVRGEELVSMAEKGLPLLVQGDTGLAVRVLQRMLADRGYYTAAVDGDFGPKTDAAVRSFQSAHKLTVDGKAGDETWGALAAMPAKAASAPAPAAPAPAPAPAPAKQAAVGVAGFSDVPADAYYAPALERLAKAGVVHGGPDGRFRPDDPLKRADAVVLLDNVIERFLHPQG